MPEEDARRCVRCGLEFGHGHNKCGDFTGDGLPLGARDGEVELLKKRVECRDRELGNIRALFRGMTRRLEYVRQSIDDTLEAIS